MKPTNNIGVVILAAGGSTRLGRPKQLVQFKGKALLQHAIDQVVQLEVGPSVVVLGGNKDQISSRIDSKGLQVVLNSDWQLGIASSMQVGFEQILSNERKIDHIMFVLSDQPFLEVSQLKRLVKTHLSGNRMATYSEYDGVLGVPAIFSQAAFPFLETLKGDQGAKKLTTMKGFEFETEPFEKGLFDIDTEEDVGKLKSMEL
ncbi:MAG: nucleotidyltransferase family protein [Allomuricauda sp.]